MLWLAVLAGIALAPAAQAQEQSEPAENAVEVNVIPYAWAVNFRGSMEQGPIVVPIDISASNAAKGIDFAFMGYGDVRSSDWLLSGQLIVADFSSRSFAPLGGADTRSQLFSGEMMTGPRVPLGPVEIDPLVGVRYNHLKGELNRDTPQAVALGRGWTTAMVGAQVDVPLTNSLAVRARGTVGVLGPRHFTSHDAAVALSYRFARRVSLIAGYRWAHETITPQDPVSGLGLSLDANGPLVALHFGPF